MASASQKSVTFAPVPSVRTAGTGSDREDRERGESEPSTTPTPTLRASPSGSPAASVRDTPAARTSREDVTPTQPTQAPPSPAPAPEASTPAPPAVASAPTSAPTSSPAATPRTPPRSTLRPPPSQRSPSAERAYVPARPSPLAHASHPPPSSMRPLNVHAHNHTHTHTHTHTAADPEPGAGAGVGAGTGTEAADTLSPPHALLPRPSTLSVSASADRTSAVTVSAPSEYSQEGTASESGEPPPGPVRMVRGADGRLYAAARYEGAGVGVGDWGERRGGEEERGGTMPLRIVPRGQYQHQHQQQYHSSYATPRMR
ncbi:hypothetical protein K439DRAFT_1173818 [Ramaria rubella]|nr:hypothetical protein K439DRAFT_1173818 [Ramaria rubella]